MGRVKKLLLLCLSIMLSTGITHTQTLRVELKTGGEYCVPFDELERVEAFSTYTPVEEDGGYLFAFMTNAHYGKLYYALSRNCYDWTTLNGGQMIDERYTGHPDICRGADGAYYMIAVNPLALWRSEDMVEWKKTPLDSRVFRKAEEKGWFVTFYYGAPKVFYDKASEQYIVTWHACRAEGRDDWDSMRTLYMLTNDFNTFTDPEPLFNFTGEDEDMAIIDCIIRKHNGKYYAIMKDERYQWQGRFGKSVRIAVADSLTGPYSNPGLPQTGLERMHEAPIVVTHTDSEQILLLAESYDRPPLGYELFKARSMAGPFTGPDPSFRGPDSGDGTDRPLARHGCIVRIPEHVYQTLLQSLP